MESKELMDSQMEQLDIHSVLPHERQHSAYIYLYFFFQ